MSEKSDLDPACENCVFYFQDSHECRRMPPQIIYMERRLQIKTMFPQIEPDQLCGEWKLRKRLDNEEKS